MQQYNAGVADSPSAILRATTAATWFQEAQSKAVAAVVASKRLFAHSLLPEGSPFFGALLGSRQEKITHYVAISTS